MGYNLFKAAIAEAKGQKYFPDEKDAKRQEAVTQSETVVKTYKSEKDRDHGIADMTRKGWVIQSINGNKGDFKVVKGVVMAITGAVLFGPLGILAGGLAGRKKQDWVIVYTK